MTIASSSCFHYLYRRHYPDAQHTWRCTKEDYLRIQYNLHSLELPDFDLNYVSGARPITRHRMFGRGDFKTVVPHLRLVADSAPHERESPR
jgi:hypothetical protein